MQISIMIGSLGNGTEIRSLWGIVHALACLALPTAPKRAPYRIALHALASTERSIYTCVGSFAALGILLLCKDEPERAITCLQHTTMLLMLDGSGISMRQRYNFTGYKSDICCWHALKNVRTALADTSNLSGAKPRLLYAFATARLARASPTYGGMSCVVPEVWTTYSVSCAFCLDPQVLGITARKSFHS